nr:MAG TPA: hypothetical protein [Caudoviricetes sp.]
MIYYRRILLFRIVPLLIVALLWRLQRCRKHACGVVFLSQDLMLIANS